MAKENVTKAKETAVEAAEKLIQKQNEKDIQSCIKELEDLQKKEAEILKKYGCLKHIKGQFIDNTIECGFIITKAPKK